MRSCADGLAVRRAVPTDSQRQSTESRRKIRSTKGAKKMRCRREATVDLEGEYERPKSRAEEPSGCMETLRPGMTYGRTREKRVGQREGMERKGVEAGDVEERCCVGGSGGSRASHPTAPQRQPQDVRPSQNENTSQAAQIEAQSSPDFFGGVDKLLERKLVGVNASRVAGDEGKETRARRRGGERAGTRRGSGTGKRGAGNGESEGNGGSKGREGRSSAAAGVEGESVEGGRQEAGEDVEGGRERVVRTGTESESRSIPSRGGALDAELVSAPTSPHTPRRPLTQRQRGAEGLWCRSGSVCCARREGRVASKWGGEDQNDAERMAGEGPHPRPTMYAARQVAMGGGKVEYDDSDEVRMDVATGTQSGVGLRTRKRQARRRGKAEQSKRSGEQSKERQKAGARENKEGRKETWQKGRKKTCPPAENLRARPLQRRLGRPTRESRQQEKASTKEAKGREAEGERGQGINAKGYGYAPPRND
ncbi:hypothetical protein C8R45DRAFT_1076653 [Mycena sanguinolenta]|nr:hypothetical protein C8R45DRAFT_1076653 [Mycena sanguinolenta]